MERELIDQYADGAGKLAMAIRGLTREDLLAVPEAKPGLGKWSIQEVVIHLSDCDGVFADRMKRVLSEDNQTLPGFDENKWAAALNYKGQSAEDAATIFELTRKQMSIVLRSASDAQLARTGIHTERGKQTVLDILGYAVRHLDHHLKFIHAKRAAMGKEMW
jgi:uncharacterized damage-inducible protein DinB